MISAPPPQKTKGEAFESLAFTFCKVATLALLLGPFVLPVAAALAAVFFLLAHFQGQKETRCIARKPLWIGLFWGGVTILWVLLKLGVFKNPLLH